MMLPRMTFFMLWLTTASFSTPLRYQPKYMSRSLHKLDKQAAFAARTATQRKFQNAPALLAGLGTCSGYAIPSSLQNAYNRASDYATNITLLSSLLKSAPGQPSYSSSVIRVATAGSAPSANGTTTDSLQDDTDGVDDFEYFGTMNFGSEAQPLQIDVDTGSADLWVPVDCTDCYGLSPFRANASSTYQNTTRLFAVSYGLGDVKGTLARDTVSLGQLKVYNQSFGAVSSVSDNFAYAPNDGLVGMAFGTISNSQQPTFFENVIPQLAAPLFSVYMTRGQPRGSEIYLGSIDASKASEKTILWVPVASKTYWTVNMTAASVNNTVLETGNLKAIIDTGTSFIYLPTRTIIPIYKLIPGAAPAPDYGDGYYSYPCDTQITVSFTLGPHELTLDPRDLNLGQYDSAGKKCISALIDAGPRLNLAILGDSFLKSYVTVFDYSHGGRVGFVKSINE